MVQILKQAGIIDMYHPRNQSKNYPIIHWSSVKSQRCLVAESIEGKSNLKTLEVWEGTRTRLEINLKNCHID
jgi:hypothetical protein